MGNCTGIIYGRVSRSDGSPLGGIVVDLDWVQRAEGGALTVGGSDDLKAFVPRCTTTQAGEYVIPFFWEAAQSSGNIASAFAMEFHSSGAYTPIRKQGQLGIGADVRKLIGVVAPPIPSGGPSAASMFLKFYIAATPSLKGMSILTRFIASFKLITTELQGLYCNIDFEFL